MYLTQPGDNGTYEYASVVQIDQPLCTGCELCVYACPQDVLLMVQDISRIAGKIARVANPGMCTGCAQCEDACPDFCIQVFEPAEKPEEQI